MDNVLYTDGHGIKVTTSNFFTGKTSYRIEGILNARMNLIRAHYAPAVLVLLLGIVALLAGALHLLPDSSMQTFYIMDILITANRIAIAAGALLLLAGLILLSVQHDRYSVHIVTAEGEKDPIVSEKKDYINQIVSALEYALKLKSGFNLQ